MSGPASVLMIDSESTWRGGEAQLELLIRGLLAEGGFAVTLAAPPDSAIAARAGAMGVTCLPLRVAGGMDLAAAWKLRGYLRTNRYDIVHCHSSHAHSVASLAMKRPFGRGRGTRRRLVVSRRVDFPIATNLFSTAKYRAGVDAYLAISNGVREVLEEGGVEGDRITLVRSGIDLDKFARVRNIDYLYDEFGMSGQTPVIGNIAALAPHKSQADFIRAAESIAKQLSGARFFVVGEGELRGELEELIRDLKLEGDVVLTGFREDVLELLSMFDCFVLSSSLEGLCTSIMDAQTMGVPVVATRTGGVPDLVEDGVTGLLVTPGRPDLLAEAVVRMMTEPGLKESCAAAATSRAESYDYRRMVSGTVDVYHRLLEHNQGGGR
ncbi:MAG: glycosyltransferase [Candidatus Krumholzibacteriia bacterium]